ncbi:MAG: iron uptake transporter permease EfeU [Acidimicrobiia bacterium]
MFGNFLIGLREGLEASLVVSLLIAYLKRIHDNKALKPLWIGVGLAIAMSIGLAALLTFTSTSLLQSFESREAFGGIMSLIAVGFVTWMIFWMKKMGRHLKDLLEEKMHEAVVAGTFAITACAFVSVSREGVETSLFFWSSLQSTRDSVDNNSLVPLWGFLIGITAAVAISIALYKKLLKINLGKFFTRTGLLLIFVAAGIAAYAFHDLQEAGIIPGINNISFDATSVLDPNSIHGAIFRGIIPISPQPTWLEIAIFLAYIGVVMSLYISKRNPLSIIKKAAPVATLIVVSVIALSACSSEKKAESTLEVTSNKNSCTYVKGDAKAGNVELKVSNKDSKVTEVYVLKNNKIVDEIEDIPSGQTRSAVITFEEGKYTIKCKPGMKGDGITTDVEITK